MMTNEKVVEALKQVFDPEIPINVWDLGLIYEHKANADGSVYIKTTMTSPSCPFADMLMADMKAKIKELTGAPKVEIELTFNPPWTKDKMTDEGKAELEML